MGMFFKTKSLKLASAIFANCIDVVPSDTVDIVAGNFYSLYIGTGGDVKVMTADDNIVTFKNVSAGFMPVLVKRVYATGTTAANIIAGR